MHRDSGARDRRKRLFPGDTSESTASRTKDPMGTIRNPGLVPDGLHRTPRLRLRGGVSRQTVSDGLGAAVWHIEMAVLAVSGWRAALRCPYDTRGRANQTRGSSYDVH